MIFLGCDAGSTKTEFLIACTQNGLLVRRVFPACNYLEVGHACFSDTMLSSVRELCKDAGISVSQIDFSVFGLPTLGEIEGLEQKAAAALSDLILPSRTLLVNDAVLGWAGSLAGAAGINVVSGTGSIVYAEDAHGGCKRVGGWSLLFDDPGSCAWIGRQTLSLFFRQADGRAPRGALYDVLCEAWDLRKNPQYFGGKMLYTFNTNRCELAKVQLLAKKAAEAGDEAVLDIYRQAVSHLVDCACVARDALRFPKDRPVSVSYSGGFFQNGACVLIPFEEGLRANGMQAAPPKYSPAVGALALGAKRFLAQNDLSFFLQKSQEVIDSSL